LTFNGTLAATAGPPVTLTGTSVTNAGPGSGPASLQSNGGALTVTNLQSNAGGIAATAGGTLTLNGAWQNAGALSENASTLNLAGTFTTSTSGLNSLQTTSGAVNFTGTLTNDAPLSLGNTGAAWNLAGGTIAGGTLTVASGTQLTATASSTLGTATAGTGVTLAGKLSVNTSVTVTVNQGLTLSGGTVQLNGFNNSTALVSALVLAGSGTQTLGGTGQVIFAGANNNTWAPLTADVLDSSAGPLTFAAGIAISNAGVSNVVAQLGNPSFPLTLNGTATASPGTPITLTGSSVTNNGTLNAAGGSLSASNLTNYASGTLTGGTWEAFAGGTLRLTTAANVTTDAATIVLDGTASSILTGSSASTSLQSSLTTVAAGGSFTIENGSSFTASAAFSDAGSLTIQSGGVLIATSGLTVQSGGTLAGSGGAVFSEVQTITVSGTSGTFTLTFNGQTTGALPFNVPASGGSGATASVQNALSALSTVGSGNVTVTGNNGGPFTVTFKGTLAGTNQPQITGAGTGGASVTTATVQDGGQADINGNVTNSGTVYPGTNGTAATFNIMGTYTQTAGGALSVDVGGSTVGAFDVLTVTGAATLAGALNVNLVNGFALSQGISLLVLTYASRSGTFAPLNTPASNNLYLVPNYVSSSTGMSLTTQGALASVYWTDGTGNWNTPGNWSTGAVPGSGDVVYIPNGDNVTFNSGTSTIAGLTNAGTFTLAGGSFTVNGVIQDQGTGTASMSGGTLVGATIAGGTTLSVTGGTVSGLTVTGTMNIPRTGGGETVTVSGDLTDDGLVTVRDGGVLLFNAASGATQNVTGTGTLTLLGSGGGNDVFLRQTGAAHTVRFTPTLALNAGANSNTIGDVNGGGLAGTWITQGTTTIPSGAELGFGTGTFTNDVGAIWNLTGGTLALGGNWLNNGTLQISGGTLSIGGTFVQANLGTYSGMTSATVNLTTVLTGNTVSLNATTGSWNLASGSIVTSSTINTTGGAQLLAPSATFDNVTINGTVTSPRTGGAHTLTILHDLTVNTGGKLSLFDGTTLGFSAAAGATQDLVGGGTLDLEGPGGGNDVFVRQFTASHTVQFAAGGSDGTAPTVSAGNNSNTIGDTGGGGFAGTWENLGTFTAVGAGVLTFSGSGTFLNDAGAAWTSTGGTLNVAGSWTNNGSITATSGTLNVAGSGSNPGTVTATGGTLNLGGTWTNSGTVTFSGGTVNVTGAITNASTAVTINVNAAANFGGSGTITGGTIAVASGVLFTQNGNFTFDGVTVAGGGAVLETNGTFTSLFVRNGLTVNGTIDIGDAAGTFYAFMRPTMTETIGGSGTIVFGGNTSNTIQTSGNGETVTFGPSLTIRGKSGTITGDNTTGFISNFVLQGTLQPDVAGGTISIGGSTNSFQSTSTSTIQIQNGGGLTIAPQTSTGTWTGSGPVTVNSGGTFTVSALSWSNGGSITLNNGTANFGGNFTQANVGTVSRTGGTVNIIGKLSGDLTLDATTGLWNLAGGGTLSGGTLTSTVGTVQQAGNFTLDNATIAAGTTVQATNGSFTSLFVRNGLTVNGTIDIGDTAGTFFAVLRPTMTETIGGSGTIVFGGNTSNTIQTQGNGDTVTFGPSLTLRGKSGTITGDNTGGFISNFVLQGTLQPDVAGGTITIGGSTNSFQSTSTSTIQTLNGDSLTIAPQTSTGTWTSAGTVTINGGTFTVNPLAWSNTGTITVSSATLSLAGSFTNATASTLSVSGSGVTVKGTVTDTGATWTMAAGNTWTQAGGTIGGNLVVASGTQLNVTNNSAFTGVALAGLVNLAAGVTLTVNQGLTLNGGTVQLNGGVNSGGGGLNVTNVVVAGTGTQTIGGTGQIIFAGGTGVGFPAQNVFASNAGPLALGPGVAIVTSTGSGTLGNSGQALTVNGTVTASGGMAVALTGSSVTNAGTPSPALQANGGILILTNLQGNAGGISASAGGTVTLAGAWQNPGTISETSATINLGGSFTTAGIGTLALTSGTVNLTGTLTNTGATLQTTAGTSWNLNGGTVLNGNVSVASGTQLGVLTASSALTNVTLSGTANVVAGATLTINQGLTLSGGTVQLNGSVNSGGGGLNVTNVVVAGSGTQTIGGTGQVVFAGSSGVGFPSQNSFASNAGPLALGPGVAVVTSTGSGTLGSSGQALTINGTVTASGGQAIALPGTSVTNAGTPSPSLQANGGTLTITNLQGNTGGISASAGGTVTLAGAWQNAGTISEASATVNLGGSFTTAGIGTLALTSGTVNLTGTQTNTGATLQTTAGTSWNLNGGTVLNGNVSVASGTQLNVFTTSSALTNVTLAGTTNVAAGATLTINQGLTLNSGAVQISGVQNSGGGGQNPASVVVAGTGTQTIGGTGQIVFAGSTGPSTVDSFNTNAPLAIGSGVSVVNTTGNGSLGSASQPLTINGTVTASTGFSISINGSAVGVGGTGVLNAAGGTVALPSPSNYAGGTLTGGTWQASAGGTLRGFSGTITTAAAGILLDGPTAHFFVGSGGTTDALSGLATIANGGSLTVRNGRTFLAQGGLTVQTGGTLAGSGAAVLNEVQTVTVSGAAGTFTLTFNGQTTGALAFNVPASGGSGNTASVQNALSALSSIGSGNVTVTGNNGGPYTVTFQGSRAGANQPQITGAGSGGATVTTATVQDGGQATIDGNVTNSGTVAPGGASTAGTLSITGTYSQTSGGTLSIELGGTVAGTGYDQLKVSGTATLDGTLAVSDINGFLPGRGLTFQALTYAAPTGDFATRTIPTYNGNPVVTTLETATSYTFQGMNIITWDGSAGDNNWGTGGNWSTGAVPTASDDVVIPALTGVSAITVDNSSTYAVRSLNANLPITIAASSTLIVNNPSTFNAGLNITGTLTANAAVTIAGASTSSSGTFSGSGPVTNTGTITILAAGMNLGGVTFTNAGTILIAMSSGGGAVNGTGTLVNTGTLTLTTNVSVAIFVPFSNQGGTVQANTGVLTLARGGTNLGGTYNATSPGTIDLTGGSVPVTFTGTYTGSGTGTVLLASGTINIGSAGAIFNFPGGLFQWTGGTLNTNGDSFVNAPTGTINLAGSGAGTLTGPGTSAVNLGTIVSTATGDWNWNLFLTNQAGGLIDLQSSGGLTGSGTITNYGTFQKSTNAGAATVGVTVTNQTSGTVQVTAGTLSLTGTVSNYSGGNMPFGIWKVLNGGTLNFPAGGAGITTIVGQALLTLGGGGASFNKLGGALTSVAGSLSLLNGATLTTGNLSVSGSVYLGAGAVLTAAGYTQANTVASPAVLTVELGGTSSGQCGSLVSTGGISLNSTSSTLNTSLVNGYTPTAGQSITFLSASGAVGGSFANTNLQGVVGTYLSPVYNSGNVALSAAVTTTATWTGSTSTDWNTATNWSGGVVPLTPNYDVVIPSGFSTINYTSIFKSVNSITASSPVSINTTAGGGLSVASASSFTDLTLNGVLAGIGNITVSHSFTWAGQSLSGLGTMTVLPGATLSITGGITVDRQVINAGTATWTAGNISHSSGSIGTVVNQGTFNAQANASVNVPFTNQAGATLNGNSGTGNKSSFALAFTSAQGATVNGNSGTLELANSGSGAVTGSGAFNIASGATLQINATTPVTGLSRLFLNR
jgi:hypothetical protein